MYAYNNNNNKCTVSFENKVCRWNLIKTKTHLCGFCYIVQGQTKFTLGARSFVTNFWIVKTFSPLQYCIGTHSRSMYKTKLKTDGRWSTVLGAISTHGKKKMKKKVNINRDSSPLNLYHI